MRRLEKLERKRGGGLAQKLSDLAGKLEMSPNTHLRVARGGAAELHGELREGGFITWTGFLRLYNLERAERGQPAVDGGRWRVAA